MRPADVVSDAAAAIGGKARGLVELQGAGFRVPPFVCMPCDVDAAVARLGPPLVVRSSASAEDGAADSFAGQFQSFLGLHTPEEVRRAVTACEQSLHAPSVAAYCRRIGIEPGGLRMGVIIQRMVEPELSGVAFTVDPMTGREQVVIEACEGIGEALLQGRRAPLPSDHPLVARHAPKIERTARAVQRHFGAPQDVEFAVQDGELFLLQARPITRIRFPPDVGEWTNADFRDGGVSSTVCTPLMWSLYETVWQEALPGFLREIRLLPRGETLEAGRMFFGRPYWNLGEVKARLASLPGFVERAFDEDMQIEARYEGNGTVTPVTLGGILRSLPTLLAVRGVWKRQARFDEDYLGGRFDVLAAPYDRGPPDDPAGAFRELVEGLFRTTETHYFRTIFCATLAKLAFSEAYPDATDTALVAGLPPIRHLEPVRVMRAMAARGERDVDALMDRFRHHSRSELDLRAPRWDEDRAWVEAMFDQLPEEPRESPRRAYASALARELALLPSRKRRSFKKRLARLRHFLWLREEMRDLSTRLYYLIRRHVLAIAEQRKLGDDVFFMTWQEIVADDRSGVARARDTFEGFRSFRAPNEIGARYGAEPRRRSNGAALSGIGASPGRATGRAHVAQSVREAMSAPPGAVLVCPFTDPGWTPVLARVAAVVTENGGLLSHAAVICREFGIPAVLGVEDATRAIQQAGEIEVDGYEGAVRVARSRASDEARPTNNDLRKGES